MDARKSNEVPQTTGRKEADSGLAEKPTCGREDGAGNIRRRSSVQIIVPAKQSARIRMIRCRKDFSMFKWALIFAVIALLAAVLGFSGVAGAAAGIAKILFFVGLALVVLFLVLGSAAAKKIS
ncbi:DUF1328 domain-containing protein [Sphingopyxis sp. MC1]|uniref:DUF1328 domain-containing protein n=1 Tax=Sphingopyxis sp. MC1 TaxID=1174684 RepID=UPI003FA45A6A